MEHHWTNDYLPHWHMAGHWFWPLAIGALLLTFYLAVKGNNPKKKQ